LLDSAANLSTVYSLIKIQSDLNEILSIFAFAI
jgi:hypothetical protein